MLDRIADISLTKAARIVGLAMIISFSLVFLVDDFILSNLIPPGDTAALANDIKANELLFGIASALYLIVLAFDASIALALYVILKPANKYLASLTSVLRLLYAAIAGINVLALVLQLIDAYSYGTIKLIGYIFFVGHLFVLGYVVLMSSYIPRVLGVLLIIASFTYVPLFYVNFLLPETLILILFVLMVMGELSIGLWLLWKSAKLHEIIPEIDS